MAVVAALFVIPLVLFVRYQVSRDAAYGSFFADIFVWGFIVRILLGLVIYRFNLWYFYGGDSTTYDVAGWDLANIWRGRMIPYPWLTNVLEGANPGIMYVTGGFYYVFGRHLLALQWVLSVIGAATPILIVKIADELFDDREVSIISALLVGFFPSIVMWTCQLMKEGLLLFLFSLVVYSVQQAATRFRGRYIAYVVLSLLAIHFLRFYMFYSFTVALTLGLIVLSRPITPASVLRHSAVSITALVVAISLLGPGEILETFQRDTQLETIQAARLDQSVSAQSGFNALSDVSTPAGALRHLPIGFTYVMFGPFPWEIENLRQLIALPEGMFWWLMIPALLRGLWLAMRYRLPESFMILIFAAGVALPYSFSQGNVGTAYRQRIQIQLFLFIFVAFGYVWSKRRRLAAKLAYRPAGST